jgi:hypothetical protein
MTTSNNVDKLGRCKLMQDPQSPWVMIWNPDDKSLSHFGEFLKQIEIMNTQLQRLENGVVLLFQLVQPIHDILLKQGLIPFIPARGTDVFGNPLISEQEIRGRTLEQIMVWK